MKLTHFALAALVAGTTPAFAQQQGSVGMDEIDASLSADSGDWSDADRAQNEAMMRMNQNARDHDQRISDLEQRIEALEQQQDAE
jgi:hypothetical protein